MTADPLTPAEAVARVADLISMSATRRSETARLMKRIGQVTGSLARVEYRIARADQ